MTFKLKFVIIQRYENFRKNQTCFVGAIFGRNPKRKRAHILKSYCQFEKNWVWILTGIARNKDNENSEKFRRRFVIKSHDDIEHSYHCLKEMMNKEGVTYRMYVSLNARDTLKTLFNFQYFN